MTIHHDKLAYGRLASMSEDFSEENLIKMAHSVSDDKEYLDVVDENGNPTGEVVERSVAHKQGIRHRTSRVWIVRKKQDKLQVLLQKRSEEKDSCQGCYDISSAGHIPSGDGYISSALRELKENLGVEAENEDLLYCGQRKISFRSVFNKTIFFDNQVSNVYLLWLDREENCFFLKKDNASEVKWFDFDDCLKEIECNGIPNCISTEELLLVKARAQKQET